MGTRIKAVIKDENFLRRMEAGEKFAKGDALSVQLRIEQRLDKHLNTYINSRYTIVEVLEHIPRGQPKRQLSLPPANPEEKEI